MRGLETWRCFVTSRPAWVVGFWAILALTVGLLAPNLTQLAAEGQAKMLGKDAESLRAGEVVSRAWPEQAYESLAVATLYRPQGLTDSDHAYAKALAQAIRRPSEGRPDVIVRVLGPGSTDPELEARLLSKDGTVQLVGAAFSTAFVTPKTQDAANWLESLTKRPGLTPPSGLQIGWTGDAIFGRDYMKGVQTSLDRAAFATVVLLLIVLLVVYRSFLLAMIPLATIGVSLLIARSILAWMATAGWEISPLVELFLVAVLFGSGTDFCLFVSWRFAEHWDPADPAAAMRFTLRRAFLALLTSAGTVMIGLLLMGTTKFALFSSTGPSVALGLAVTLAATLTLTPALLIMLAKARPASFRGFTNSDHHFWAVFGKLALSRPITNWAMALVLMVPMALVAFRSTLIQDVMTEMSESTASVKTFRLLSSKFEPGLIAPLTVVLESDQDLKGSEGLALIDDLSRYLSRRKSLSEVRSATQPLGSPKLLEKARIGSRISAVNAGFGQIGDGIGQIQKGMIEGAAKLRTALWLEKQTGVSLKPQAPGEPRRSENPEAPKPSFSGLMRAALVMSGGGLVKPPVNAPQDKAWDGAAAGSNAKPPKPEGAATPAPNAADPKPNAATPEDPRLQMVNELTEGSEGVKLILDGVNKARHEVASILADPVGRKALDQLLILPETLQEHPELKRSFAVYITPDGRHARMDLSQTDRVFSAGAMDGVVDLRHKIGEFLDEVDTPHVTATITGANAESADIRALTRSDQVQSWFVIPIGVFIVLVIALHDPLSCLNLVATMLLTYAFALGATHLLFVNVLGAAGLDWKVPYFLFVLLVAVGVDYNVFLMARLREESHLLGLKSGIERAVAQTGGLITSAAAITACSFASFMISPLGSLRQLGFALVVGLTVDALVVRPLLVPCGHWILCKVRDRLASLPSIEAQGGG